jgi:putative restriction endonuclease
MKEALTDLTISIKQFASLNRAPGATWTEATKRKAPHKPILLLAVLDLVHRSVITSPFIAVTGDLVELNELFNLYWRRIIPLGQTSSIAFPFSRLDREPFWELVPQPGTTGSHQQHLLRHLPAQTCPGRKSGRGAVPGHAEQ